MQPGRDLNSLTHDARLVLQNLLSMIDHTFMHEIQQQALDDMVRLTRSEVGFFSLVDAAAGTIRLKLISVPGSAAQPLYPEVSRNSSEPGHWNTCLAARTPVIRNQATQLSSPATSAFSPMHRDLTLPIFEGDQIVATITVANRPDDYKAEDAEVLQRLAHGLWRVVIRKRLHDNIANDVK